MNILTIFAVGNNQTTTLCGFPNMPIEISTTKDENIISHNEEICPFMVRQAHHERVSHTFRQSFDRAQDRAQGERLKRLFLG